MKKTTLLCLACTLSLLVNAQIYDYCAKKTEYLTGLTDNSGLSSNAKSQTSNPGNVHEYYKNAKDLNFQEVKGKVKTTDESACQYLKEFEKEYTNYFNSKLQSLLNDFIEYTYQISKTDKTGAADAIKVGEELSDASLLIIPDNTTAIDLNKQIKELKIKVCGEAYAAFSKFPLHQKYMDKIVFSKKPIIYGKENEADFTNSFTGQDKIYGMVYLKKDIKTLNDGKDMDYIFFKMYIDGNESNWQPRKNLTAVDQTMKYWQFEIIPDPAEATGITAKDFMGAFKDISPRKHKIHVDMGDWNSGSDFELDWSNANVEQLEANANLAVEKAETNMAKKRQLPEEFIQPSKPYKDVELSQVNLTKMFKTVIPDCAQILKIHTDPGAYPEWNIVKNDINIPTKKGTASPIWVVWKTTDNLCWFTEAIWVEKAYEGGGKYSTAIAMFSGYRSALKIACENVK